MMLSTLQSHSRDHIPRNRIQSIYGMCIQCSCNVCMFIEHYSASLFSHNYTLYVHCRWLERSTRITITLYKNISFWMICMVSAFTDMCTHNLYTHVNCTNELWATYTVHICVCICTKKLYVCIIYFTLYSTRACLCYAWVAKRQTWNISTAIYGKWDCPSIILSLIPCMYAQYQLCTFTAGSSCSLYWRLGCGHWGKKNNLCSLYNHCSSFPTYMYINVCMYMYIHVYIQNCLYQVIVWSVTLWFFNFFPLGK